MSLLNKFKSINNFIYNSDYYILNCNKREIGYVHVSIAEEIIANIEKVQLLNRTLYLKEKNKKKLNNLVSEIAKLLVAKKKIDVLSGEFFSCLNDISHKEVFRLDRTLVEYLGIRGYGVHLIAYIKKNNSYKIWVPKRNSNKSIDPSKLDNTVAGGIKAGENIYHALKREANEEAGISSVELKDAKLVGTLNYNWKKSKYSVRRDTLFLFELEVDESFYPICKDGEVENFVLMDWKKVLKLIQETNKFKINCALVTAKFFIRHGLLTDRNENNYEQILRF